MAALPKAMPSSRSRADRCPSRCRAGAKSRCLRSSATTTRRSRISSSHCPTIPRSSRTSPCTSALLPRSPASRASSSCRSVLLWAWALHGSGRRPSRAGRRRQRQLHKGALTMAKVPGEASARAKRRRRSTRPCLASPWRAAGSCRERSSSWRGCRREASGGAATRHVAGDATRTDGAAPAALSSWVLYPSPPVRSLLYAASRSALGRPTMVAFGFPQALIRALLRARGCGVASGGPS
mmetsp:Transcript_50169/g.115796  ORF Transcript_50169/g.115796 Transcript_50169/m.115796 type:complete len:238 (-) Transcript_50169:92-805(-)